MAVKAQALLQKLNDEQNPEYKVWRSECTWINNTLVFYKNI